jgi:hypothetical protein
VDAQIGTQSMINELAQPVDCACLIHGDAYDWVYVERLYNMLQRNLSGEFRLHVYTEAERPVPAPMIKHELTDWGISGHRRSWWYKLQLFNTQHHAGPLLYFDLDTVIVDNIDWICNLPLKYFWTVRDFKYLWRPGFQGINSSIMRWDTRNFASIFQDFKQKNLSTIIKQFPGDQDYLTQQIGDRHLRFLDSKKIQSWRWQCKDGGYDFKKRCFLQPNSGTKIASDTSVLIFHGTPKPKDIKDALIDQHWR